MLGLKLWERTREKKASPGLLSWRVVLLEASQEHVYITLGGWAESGKAAKGDGAAPVLVGIC